MKNEIKKIMKINDNVEIIMNNNEDERQWKWKMK